MGARGPAPTPSKILKLRGSWRADANPDEPVPSDKAPSCPSWLDRDGKRAWRQMVKHIADMKILSETDVDALAIYCDTWSDYRKAVRTLREEGLTHEVHSQHGCSIKKRPEVSIKNDAIKTLLRYQQEFGLTPSSRSRVVVGDTNKKPKRKSKFFGDAS